MSSSEIVKAEPVKTEPVKAMFERDDVKQRFNELLGKKAPGFIVSVINAVQNNEMLREADKQSVLFAAATAASLDLPIDPNLGFAYLIPYNKKQPDGSSKQFAQFQMGYKGFIQLSQRTGTFKTMNSVPVYEGDNDDSVKTRLVSIITPEPPSEKIIGYAAYFLLLNGFEKYLYMSVDELKGHGLKYSQSYRSKKSWVREASLWTTDFDAMGKKTVLKLLLAKYAPLSIEMQRAVIADQGVMSDWNDMNPEYPDNQTTIPDVDEVAKRKEADRIKRAIEKAETLKELSEISKYLDWENENELRTLYEDKLNLLSKKK